MVFSLYVMVRVYVYCGIFITMEWALHIMKLVIYIMVLVLNILVSVRSYRGIGIIYYGIGIIIPLFLYKWTKH